jgi:hypothetical protein
MGYFTDLLLWEVTYPLKWSMLQHQIEEVWGLFLYRAFCEGVSSKRWGILHNLCQAYEQQLSYMDANSVFDILCQILCVCVRACMFACVWEREMVSGLQSLEKQADWIWSDKIRTQYIHHVMFWILSVELMLLTGAYSYEIVHTFLENCTPL